MHQSRATETQGNHDLFEAFNDSGCPICTLTLEAVSRYMTSTNYDSVSDPEIRKQFETSHAFCNFHAHQWLKEAFILGTAQIYRDVLLVTYADLRRRSFQAVSPGQRIGSLFGRKKAEPDVNGSLGQPTAPCPACAILVETETRLLRTLLIGLGEVEFRDAYDGSDGLCVPHLRTGLADSPHQKAFDSLKQRAIGAQETLLTLLDESIRKHDYRFRHEPAGEESGSAARAVSYVAGASGAAKPVER
jgi:hypothetical protein